MSSTPPTKKIAPRVKLWLEIDDQRFFCSGICKMLEAVDRTGSIKDAAAELGRSYRFVWGKIKAVERSLDRRLVETRVGGELSHRSSLTADGRALVQQFATFRSRVNELLAAEFEREFHNFPPSTRSP